MDSYLCSEVINQTKLTFNQQDNAISIGQEIGAEYF